MNKEEQIKFIEDNYPLYTNHTSNRRIRHDFFSEIKTELQSYLLGFYTADGSIDEKRKTLRIHLQKCDSEIVYLYKENISPDARIFQELKKDPSWWVRFKNDSSLYIEIRKNNQVNVYFEGGSVARIHYCSKYKKLQIFTHHKYLNLPAPSKNNPYIPKDPENLECDKVIERVKVCYSQKHAINGVVDKEKWSEKFIQGALITQSLDFHLDSEFAYNDATDKNRIDLVRCDNGVITFVELKRISDGRMLHKTEESPEIIYN